jgi:phosphate acetyltransferase
MILDEVLQRAIKRPRSIAFPDAEDVRTLDAARVLADEAICTPVLVGSMASIVRLADEEGRNLDGIRVIDPVVAHDNHRCAEHLLERRGTKGLTPDQAKSLASQPLYYAGWLVHAGHVDAAVAGSISTTGDVVRAGLWTVGLADGCSTVSSYFLMALKDRTLVYTDAGVVPEPTIDQLVDIASAACDNYRAIINDQPRCAFLSFSTKGSASHPAAERMRTAAEHFAARRPDVPSDGELQADAAVVPAVAERKAPSSPLQGTANVLVFPDLNSGNIAYKITERLAGATAVGPIIQGLAKPYCDLSRGCSVKDIVLASAIASAMAR